MYTGLESIFKKFTGRKDAVKTDNKETPVVTEAEAKEIKASRESVEQLEGSMNLEEIAKKAMEGDKAINLEEKIENKK